MLTSRLFRWAALAALLAAFVPAPASAQLGRFIKNKLKEKIAKAVVETVVPADTSATASIGGGRAALGSAMKGDVERLPRSGPVFTDAVLEITHPVIAKLEQGLVAEVAERQAGAAQMPRILSFGDYNKCIDRLKATPDGDKAYKATDSEYQAEREKATATWERLELATCGPYPGSAYKYRQQLANRQVEAIQKASGLTPRQYEILKERVIPFCTLGASTADHSVPHVAQGGVFLVYTVQEIMALGPWCPKLSLSFKALT